MQVARLARAWRPRPVRRRLLAAAAAAVHLHRLAAVAVPVAAITATAVRRAVGRPGGGKRRLLAHLFEDLPQQGGEGLDVAGAEEGEGAVLDLSGPVVGMGVEGVEEVFLDPVCARSPSGSLLADDVHEQGTTPIYRTCFFVAAAGDGWEQGCVLLVVAVCDQLDVDLRPQVLVHSR